MKSNVCKIENGTKDLDAILRESEKVAVYNDLTHKQTLQLRLICEEIDGMLPNIIGNFNGDLWFEFENGVCRVNISLVFEEFTAEKKQELVAVSKNKKNAAAVGIVGKIRSVVEDIILDETPIYGINVEATTYYYGTVIHNDSDYDCVWDLENYRNSVKEAEIPEAWDELEKSVIASVADDVIVGVKGKRAQIVIIKKFA